MQATDGAAAPQGMNGVRAGKLISRELLVGKDGALNNYSFQIGASESAYAVPRHRHNFDQVRYNVRGQIKYGDTVFPTGWVVYFPEGAYYGPQMREVDSLTLLGKIVGDLGAAYAVPLVRMGEQLGLYAAWCSMHALNVGRHAVMAVLHRIAAAREARRDREDLRRLSRLTLRDIGVRRLDLV